MVWEDLTPSDIFTEKAFENAITCVMALGGSTNAIIHLVAMAGRLGLKIDLERFDAISTRTPWLANIRPSGKYLMEDFFYAGGVRGLMAELKDLLHLDCLTVNGKTLGENLEGADIYNTDVISRRESPLSAEGGLAVLRGNLAPNGAVIKQTACDPSLVKHKGPAVVFSDYNDMAARIDDETLDVTKDSVLVLKHGGPQGGPGMPEWGMLPIPKKLLKQGVRDMVRISDARMSGTSYGTCVLHVSPESFIGGPLALVETGDLIELDIAARTLQLHVDENEIVRRKNNWERPKRKFERGFGAIYANHITQADLGCDFDILEGNVPTADPEIH
jgi:dihydroxy-acid dehydratase